MSEGADTDGRADWLASVARCRPHAVDTRCREGRCRLATQQVQSFVILLGEKARQAEHPVCDCIVFFDNNRRTIGLVELKSRTLDATHVAEQVRGGVRVAIDILTAARIDPDACSFYPVVLCQACTTSEREILQRQRIDIGGKRHDVIVKRCGADLGEIIVHYT